MHLLAVLLGLALPPQTELLHFLRILNEEGRVCLDVEGSAGRSGDDVALGDCDGGKGQTWAYTAAGELRNGAQQICLDADGTDGAEGRNVRLSACTGESDQLWDWKPSGGLSILKNRASLMCLDVAGSAGKRGDHVQLWRCDGGRDQAWAWAAALVPNLVPPPEAIGDEAFAKVLEAMRKAALPDRKVQAFTRGMMGHEIRCAQLAQAVRELASPGWQLAVVRIVAAHVVDPQNVAEVVAAVAFDSDRNTVRELILPVHWVPLAQ